MSGSTRAARRREAREREDERRRRVLRGSLPWRLWRLVCNVAAVAMLKMTHRR